MVKLGSVKENIAKEAEETEESEGSKEFAPLFPLRPLSLLNPISWPPQSALLSDYGQ